MADFSISQFKQYVQTFINATGIDDGNGVIESKNGELSKVLSNFGLEESQIGDLLEKSDNSTNNARRVSSTSQPYPEDIHKDFLKAQEKYDNMTPEQQYNVRKETMNQAAQNFDNLQNSFITELREELTPLTDNDLQNIVDVNIDPETIQSLVNSRILSYAKVAYENMSANIEKYNNAFGEYDVTYRSPYEVSTAVGTVNLADMCMTKIAAKIQEFQSITLPSPSSPSFSEYIKAAVKLIADVNSLVQETNNKIENIAESIGNVYKNDFEQSMYALEENIMKQWIAPLDDTYHEPEPDTIAIKGAPIEKTFTDVVNSSATTDITSVRTDSKKAPVYDLSGKQVTGDLQKGQIYIQNGKKFVAQ